MTGALLVATAFCPTIGAHTKPGTTKFEDPWEGHYPRIHSDPKRIRDAYNVNPAIDKTHIDMYVDVDVRHAARQARDRDTSGINCWHANNFESDALWKLYASKGVGVAVSSTAGALKASMSGFSEPLFIGQVRYLDHENDAIPRDNVFWPLLWKRHSFSHEHEVRAVVDMGSDVFQKVTGLEFPDIYDKPTPGPIPPGRSVPVNLDTLIEVIHVSPLAEPLFLDAVRSLVSKYSLDKEVRPSNLLDPPLGTTSV